MKPLWPLATPVQTQFSPSAVYMANRAASKTAPAGRFHAGQDLQASEGALILATELTTVVAVNRGWDGTAKATLVHVESGHSLLLGCTALDSAPPPGTVVEPGKMIASVGYYTKQDGTHSSMLHFQAYDALITAAQANSWQSWHKENPKPPHLIDPMVYLAGAQAQVDPPSDTPPGPDVKAEGGLNTAKPCTSINGQMVCMLDHVAAWRVALGKYMTETLAVLQQVVALVNGGTYMWNADTDVAIYKATRSQDVRDEYDKGTYDNLLPNDLVDELLYACQDAVTAKTMLEAFIAGGPNAEKEKEKTKGKGGGGGAAAAVGAIALLAVGIGVGVARSRR